MLLVQKQIPTWAPHGPQEAAGAAKEKPHALFVGCVVVCHLPVLGNRPMKDDQMQSQLQADGTPQRDCI